MHRRHAGATTWISNSQISWYAAEFVNNRGQESQRLKEQNIVHEEARKEKKK